MVASYADLIRHCSCDSPQYMNLKCCVIRRLTPLSLITASMGLRCLINGMTAPGFARYMLYQLLCSTFCRCSKQQQQQQQILPVHADTEALPCSLSAVTGLQTHQLLTIQSRSRRIWVYESKKTRKQNKTQK